MSKRSSLRRLGMAEVGGVDRYLKVARRRDCRASWASWAAWNEAGGRPPREAARDSEEIGGSVASSLPWMDSVKSDAQAMEAVQPRQRKRTSRMMLFSMMAAS